MNKINKISALVLVLLGLSSCSLYSKFETPEIDEQAQELYTYLEANQDTTTIASMPWKSFFTDPCLVELIETALSSNTNMKLAKLSVDQAEIALKTARLAYVPSFNFDPKASFSYTEGMITNKYYNVSVSMSWEVDLFGKLTNAKRMEQAAVEQSKVYKEAVQTQLIATMANSYYSLLTLDEQLRISRETKIAWEANLAAMKALMKAGKVDNSSVLQTQASSVALDASIAELESQIIELESAISNLLAKAPSKIKRGTLGNVTFSDNLAVGVPMQLLSKRADVKFAEYSLSQAFYATNYAKSSLYPSITLGGSIGYTGNSLPIINPGEMIYSVAASLLQPIFNSGALKAQVKISKSKQEQALLTFKQTVLDAGTEVNSALNSLQTAKVLVENDKKQIGLLAQVVSNKELMMKHGSVNYLEVLTAQMTLLQSELSLSADQYSEIQSVINLYRALGGGAE